MGNITINTGDANVAKYVDYSSCFEAKNRKKPDEKTFSEKVFNEFIKNTTSNEKDITKTELQKIFSGITQEQADQLIKNADGLHVTSRKKIAKDKGNNKLNADELMLALNEADRRDISLTGRSALLTSNPC